MSAEDDLLGNPLARVSRRRRTTQPSYRERVRIWESDYGRARGWDLELDGRVVAMMDEPRWEDMFWVSYRLTPITEDAGLAQRLMSEPFWKTDDACSRLVYRSRATGHTADGAVSATVPFVAPGRVNMRALYVHIRPPRPWDRLVLTARRVLGIQWPTGCAPVGVAVGGGT